MLYSSALWEIYPDLWILLSVVVEVEVDRWIELSETEKSFEGLINMLLKQQLIEKGGPSLAMFLKERKPQSVSEIISFADTFFEAHIGQFGNGRPKHFDSRKQKFPDKGLESSHGDKKRNNGDSRSLSVTKKVMFGTSC